MRKRLLHLIEKTRESFILISIASFLWLLYRTGTRPSRITYPCQKAAAVNVTTFIYLAPLLYGHKVKDFFKYRFDSKLLIRNCLIFFAIITAFFGAGLIWGKYQLNKGIKKLEAHKNHPPLGVSAIPRDPSGFVNIQHFETRVVSVHDSSATNWDYETGYWWVYIEQEVVNNMVAQGVWALTGKTNT